MAWGEVWKSLSENLIWVSIMFAMFALCVLANIIAEIYYQVRQIGKKWNCLQLVSSILRMMAIGVSKAILAVVATVAPIVLSSLGLMNEEFCKLISVSMIIGMYVRGIVKYFKEALTTVDNILANRDVVEELQDALPEDIQKDEKTEMPFMADREKEKV